MKRSLVLLAATLLALSVIARDGPDDQYVVIYNLIQDGDSLNDKAQPAQALAKYLDAQKALKSFQYGYPTWNIKVVNYRLKYLAARIAQVSMTLPSPAATNATGGTMTNGPSGLGADSGTNSLSTGATNAAENAATNTPAAAPAIPPENAPATNAPATQPGEMANPPGADAAPPASAPEADVQTIRSLQDQVQHLAADRDLLEAKLKEALAAQPPGVDPRELARAEEQIRSLEKENALLKVTIEQNRDGADDAAVAALEQTRRDLAEANLRIAQLTDANTALTSEQETLQARLKAPMPSSQEADGALRAENALLKKEVVQLKATASTEPAGSVMKQQLLEAQAQIAALQSDKQILSLETAALESRIKTLSATAGPISPPAFVPAPVPAPAPPVQDQASAAKIKQLEAERDELRKSLAAAARDARHEADAQTEARVDELTRELAVLRARVGVFESRPVPYSPGELSLFNLPANTIVASAHNSSRIPSARPSANEAELMLQARGYYAVHDLAKAEQKYLELINQDDKNAVALGDLATVEIDLGHMDNAEKYVMRALDGDPQDSYSLSVLGRLKLEEGKSDEALDALSQAAQMDPQNAEIQNYLGITLSRKGLRGPAETALRKAIELDPNNASAHNNLAVVYATQTPPFLELARWHYQKALAAGEPRNLNLEKLLDPSKVAPASASAYP
jgi:tetratricopeptide (TPR) repeat protein